MSLVIQSRLIVIATCTFQPALKEKIQSVIHSSTMQSFFLKAVITIAMN